MADRPTLLVVGGTSGIGQEIASRAVQRGERVFQTGRDAARTQLVADEVGAAGLSVDLTRPMRSPLASMADGADTLEFPAGQPRRQRREPQHRRRWLLR